MFFILPMPTLPNSILSNYARPAFILLAAVFGLSLNKCSEPLPHEQQVENSIHQIANALEQLDANELEKHLDKHIDIDHQGKKLDMDQVRKIMMLYRFKKQTIRVNIAKIDISMDSYNSHLAKANITALVTGSKGLLPDDGKLYRIKSQWRLYDEQWKLQQVSWQ